MEASENVEYSLRTGPHRWERGNFTRMHPTRRIDRPMATSYTGAQWETNYEITILSDFRHSHTGSPQSPVTMMTSNVGLETS
ncbi:hypothetical protein HZH66_003095 [Vespula vulgaris]|uniref:Uncharacterized protein n=1 Tax=Vespula vulgaris TaxID=7454 RepID=A0A834NID3_VESVU|nr:hypothetical protein HZH66_003095 [Vespula vulgaris]